MLPGHNKKYLYEFPSFPGLTLEERRRLTYTAMTIFSCTDKTKLTEDEIYANVMNNVPINPETKVPYRTPYFGPYDTTFDEFLTLPEIACLVYHVRLTDTQTNEQTKKFVSYMDILNENRNKYHIFRLCVVRVMKEAADDLFTHDLGSLSLQEFCLVFNNFEPINRAYGWTIFCEGPIPFLDNKRLIEVLCTFCSRELIIRIHSNKHPTLRLRNHQDALTEQIEDERALADKALDFYFKYQQDNPEDFEWKFRDSEEAIFCYEELETPISSYHSYFLDNVYAALHHSVTVHDLQSLATTVSRYTKAKLSARTRHCLAPSSSMNMLLDMVSAEGLTPLQYWDKDKVFVYLKIVEELTLKISVFDRSFVYEFIELTHKKSGALMFYSLWSFKKMAKHILYVTCYPKFQSAGKIADVIKTRYKYDINKWLQCFCLSSINDLFQMEELNDLLNAICVRNIDGKKTYRNMESVMADSSFSLGFPYIARKRLLNCLEEAKLRNAGTNGFINEKTFNDAYAFCYKQKLDQFEKNKIFGKNYDTVTEFLKEYDCKEITIKTENDETVYGITGEFDTAHQMVLDEKKACYEAVKFWKGMRAKDIERKKAGPQSAFSLWKWGELNYDIEIAKASKRRLARARR